MDIFHTYGLTEELVREHLANLDWRGALTTSEIYNQLPALPPELFADIPDGAIFHSEEEVLGALKGEIDFDEADFPTDGAESLGGPAGYGPSTTGRLVTVPNSSGGIGSGTDTGDTGSGNTEATGWGRAGTTFGKEAVEEERREEAGGDEDDFTEGLA